MPSQDVTFFDISTRRLQCKNDWDLAHYENLRTLLETLTWPTEGEVIFNGAGIKKFDSAGACLLIDWQHRLEKKHLHVSYENFTTEHHTLLAIIEKELPKEKNIPEIKSLPMVARAGKNTLNQLDEFCNYLAFIGQLSYEALRTFNPKHIRITSLTSVIYHNGYAALPIIGLLSFMIGVVITYQMGLQLKNYGANIYIVDLLGISVLREFGPLLTAIMIAGRTGSSYTAQLGMMKLNQEIDALNTMGVTPAELLLLPRIAGLVIALPLLTMWSDIFGVMGGMVMSNNMLSITWHDFLNRFPNVVPLRALLIGLGKAPIFALIIASIGCYQGVQVKGSAESVGQNTTRSVVLAIFFIIVADAIFSVIFSKLKL